MNTNPKNILKIILSVFAVAIIAAGVFLSKQKQEIRKGATESGNPGQIKLSPSTAVYTPGQPTDVNIVFNTGGVFMSGVAATIVFDSSPNFIVSEIEKKITALDYCSLFGQTTENGKTKMGIACFASGAGTVFDQDTVLGSFTITPSSSTNDNFSIEFLPGETEMKGKNNDQIVNILGSLPSPAGTYNNQASPTSPPSATSPPTQPPSSTATPIPPTATPSPGGIGSSCSDTSFSTANDIGYLAANPEKTLEKFIANTSGTVNSAELYFSSWNNSPRQITLWINGIEASSRVIVPKDSGGWYQFNFQASKPEITIGQTIRVEVLQDANWDTAAAWNRDSQGRVLKLKINCFGPTATPAPTATPTLAPTPTATSSATPSPTQPPPTATPTLPPGATQAPASPTATPGPIACSTELPPSQCTCATTTNPQGSSCGVIMRQRGDFDCNGQINTQDFNKWMLNFVYNNSAEDMNCNGQTGIDDFGTWLTGYLSTQ